MRKHFKGLFQAFMIALVIYLAVGCMLCIGVLYLLEVAAQTGFQRKDQACLTLDAAPLPSEIVNDLCTRGIVPDILNTCSRANAIYSQNLRAIVAANVHIDKSTYEEVEVSFGEYQTFCTEQDYTRDTQQICHYLIGTNQFYVFFDAQNDVVNNLQFISCSLGLIP